MKTTLPIHEVSLLKEPSLRKPIWGLEGYVDGDGNIRHKTVIVGYEEAKP